MSICVNVIIQKNTPPENYIKFLETLKKTLGDFCVCIVSACHIVSKDLPLNYNIANIIENNIDPGFATLVNQGLFFSSSSGFDYSISVNSKYALVVKEEWLRDVLKQLSKDSNIGGTVYPAKINNSNSIKEVLYSINASANLNWLSKWVNRYMMISFVDGNIFIVRNSFINKIKLPASKFCDSSLYGIFLSLSSMRVGQAPQNIESIYSSSNDIHRYDIFPVIEKGAGIIYPVVIDSVRARFGS